MVRRRRSAARSERHCLLTHRGCIRHICACGQAGRSRVRQMSPSRIRIEPSSSYDFLSMSVLAALRIRARFLETDAIGSDAEARNLFLRTSIEILHSTRFPPTTAAIVATLVIGFHDSSRGNEMSLSSVFRVRPPVNFTVLPFRVDTAAGHIGVHRRTLPAMQRFVARLSAAEPRAARTATPASCAQARRRPPSPEWLPRREAESCSVSPCNRGLSQPAAGRRRRMRPGFAPVHSPPRQICLPLTMTW